VHDKSVYEFSIVPVARIYFFFNFQPIFAYTRIITLLYQTYRCSQRLFLVDIEPGIFSNARKTVWTEAATSQHLLLFS